LSPKLLKPVNPIFQSAVSTLAALPLRVVILAPLIAALVWWRPEIVVLPSAGAFALFVLSVAMAWLLSFLVQATFGMLSFWFDQTLGLFGVWFGLWAVFSGYVAPLGLFPEWAQAILRWLPFRAMLAVPVELLGGFTRAEDAAFDVGMQAVWVAVFFGLAVFVWSHGVRRYGAFGA
jgi:ABC-2 type transport system permease protein